MSNSTDEVTVNHNLLKIGNRVLKMGSRVLTPPPPELDYVKIGNQRWMKKNMAVDDGGEGIFKKTVDYGHGEVTEYYYNFYAAVRVAGSIPHCHLPTWDEWKTLVMTVGGVDVAGTKLKSTYGWKYKDFDGNGTDDYGFCALPTGESQGGRLGSVGYFWTATGHIGGYAEGWYFRLADGAAHADSSLYKENYFAVRLIKEVFDED